MKHLSRLDIEAIAEKYITAYMELPEVQDMQIYRIEPELFLERVLGLKIDYAHLSYDGSLLGMTSFVEVMVDVMTADFEEEHILLDGSTVLVESDLRDDNKRKGRRNFTLMHEGSHQILRDNDLGGGQVDDEIMRYRDKLIRQAQNLPIWERKCLTVDEAAEYSGIGRKKLRSLLKKKNCPFALSDGFQLLIIREKLDEYCKKHKRI